MAAGKENAVTVLLFTEQSGSFIEKKTFPSTKFKLDLLIKNEGHGRENLSVERISNHGFVRVSNREIPFNWYFWEGAYKEPNINYN